MKMPELHTGALHMYLAAPGPRKCVTQAPRGEGAAGVGSAPCPQVRCAKHQHSQPVEPITCTIATLVHSLSISA